MSKVTEPDPTEPATAGAKNLPAKAEPKGSTVMLTVDDLKAMLAKVDEEVETNPDDIQDAILQRMLNARSADELFAPTEVVKWADNLEKPVTVLNIRFNSSDFEDGQGVYAVCDAMMDGAPVLLSCGARTPMLQLLIAREKGWLPYDVIMVQSPRPTKSGYKPFNLLPAPVEEPPF